MWWQGCDWRQLGRPASSSASRGAANSSLFLGLVRVWHVLRSYTGSQAVDVCTECAYTGNVGFEWDHDRKAGVNFRKHGVRMPEAIPVFDDPFAITIPDDESDPGEQRFITLGMGAAERLLVVVHTWRGENIRIISVRTAEAHERAEYEAER